MQIIINLPQILIQAIKLRNMSLYQICTNENRFIDQGSWITFYYVIWENGLVGIPLPTNMAAAI